MAVPATAVTRRTPGGLSGVPGDGVVGQGVA